MGHTHNTQTRDNAQLQTVAKEGSRVIDIEQAFSQKAKIRVIGIGGGGNNAVNRMIEDKVNDVDFIAVNTDSQALRASKAGTRIQLGTGLGAGGIPEKGREAAQETIDELTRAIEGADMLFITAGMGGGTGTGASPVVADLAKDMGILTVGVVTSPFSHEGKLRMRRAQAGIDELLKHVDTLVVVPNEKLEAVLPADATLEDAFKKADETLTQGVQAIVRMMEDSGLVNVDFADLQTTMRGKGMAHIGIGRASGKDRHIKATEAAIASPLLETSIDGAKHLLLSMWGDKTIGLAEMNAIGRLVGSKLDDQADISQGAFIDEKMEGEIIVTIIATGFGSGSPLISANTAEGEAAPEAPAEPERKPLDKIQDTPAADSDDVSFDLPIFLKNRHKERR